MEVRGGGELIYLGVGERQAKLMPNFIEKVHLALHVHYGSLPEIIRVGLLKPNRAGLLEGTD
jgi:hypothetical protein